MDERAAAAWGADASVYERVRPSYAPKAVDWLCEGLPDGAAVLDLAAGTGKLTRALLERGYDVTSVEPLPGMRAELTRFAPRVIDGVAESIPAADGAFAAVFVGEGFHWFGPEAVGEMRRVAARAGLLWNYEAWTEEPWSLEIEALLGPSTGSHHPSPRGTWGAFAEAESRSFRHVHRLDADGLAGLVGTWSRVAARPDRDALLARVRELVPGHVELPYDTLAVRAA